MRAARRQGPYKIGLEEIDVPDPGPGEVRIRIEAVGVCGGDLHYFRGSPGVQFTDESLIMGHEGVGVVDALGLGVTDFALGERVVIEPQTGWCGHCTYCERNLKPLCAEREDMGYVVDGACAEFITIAAGLCFKAPAELDLEELVNVHALAAVMHALDRVTIEPGASVVIVGPGAAGLLMLQATKALRGAANVIVVGRSQPRLDLAGSLGADRTINSRTDDVAEIVMDMTQGHGADLVIDTSGNVDAQAVAITLLRKRGTFLAYSRGRLELDLQVVLKREHTIIGSTGVTGFMNRAMQVIATGQIRTAPLITHRFELAETQAAFDQAVAEDKGEYVKGLIYVDGGALTHG